MIKNIFYIVTIVVFVMAVFLLLSDGSGRSFFERLGVQKEEVRDRTSEIVDTTRIEQGRSILERLSSIIGRVDVGNLRGRFDDAVSDKSKVVGVPLIRGESLIDPDKVGWESEELKEAKRVGDYVGCGESVFYLERQVPPGKDPLIFVYEELFLIGRTVTIDEKSYSNPVAYHREETTLKRGDEVLTFAPLSLDRVDVKGEKAILYLTGDYLSIGTCEPPRLKAVLEFAALQFADISNIEVYLNEERMEFIHGGK